jgi:ATP-dependent protease Clp ATPase subunit
MNDVVYTYFVFMVGIQFEVIEKTIHKRLISQTIRFGLKEETTGRRYSPYSLFIVKVSKDVVDVKR